MWSGGTYAGSDVISVLTLEPYAGNTDNTGESSGCTWIPDGGTSIFTVINNDPAHKDHRSIDQLGKDSGIPIRSPVGIYTVQVKEWVDRHGTAVTSGSSSFQLDYQVSLEDWDNDSQWDLTGTTTIFTCTGSGSSTVVQRVYIEAGRFIRFKGTLTNCEGKPTLLLLTQ